MCTVAADKVLSGNVLPVKLSTFVYFSGNITNNYSVEIKLYQKCVF